MFSKLGPGWQHSQLGSHLQIIGVFSIAQRPDSVFCEHNNDDIPHAYYVVNDKDLVRLRYLLVWKVEKSTIHRSNQTSKWILLAYAVILLFVVLYQINWVHFRKSINRFIRHWNR